MRVSHIENHLEQQTAHMQFIAKAGDNLMSVGSENITTHILDTRQNALEEAWSQFSLNYDVILIAMKQLTLPDKQ